MARTTTAVGRYGNRSGQQRRQWKYRSNRVQASGARGRGYRLTPPPTLTGYDYSRCPPNLLHPTGYQPPGHAADPRWRGQNRNELDGVHQYCAWRTDPGRLRPSPGCTTACQAGTQAGTGRQPPWKHFYGQANIAAAIHQHIPPAYGPVTAAGARDPETTYHDDDHDVGNYCEQPTPANDIASTTLPVATVVL